MTTIQDLILHLKKKDPNTFVPLLEQYLKTPNANLNQLVKIQREYVSLVLIAVQKGHTEILKLLVNHGAKLVFLGGFEDAIQSNSIEILRFLLTQNTHYNTTPFLKAAIIKAIQLHRLDMIALLLDFCFERYLMFEYNCDFLQTVSCSLNTSKSNAKQISAIIKLFIEHGLHSITDLSLFSKKQRALIYSAFEKKEQRLCSLQTKQEIILDELKAHHQQVNILEGTRVLSTAAYLPQDIQQIVAQFLFLNPPPLLFSNPLNKTLPVAASTPNKLKKMIQKKTK